MSKDIFKVAGYHWIGPGGIHCQCCDNKLSHHRKSKIQRNMLSKLKRNALKIQLRKDIKDVDK